MYLNILLFTIFILLSISNIVFVKKNNNLGKHITKPLLMPMLLVVYLCGTTSPNWLIILALIFGFLGDTFLMGTGSFFIAGLLSFLLGHLFYIIALLGSLSLTNIPFIFYATALPYILCGIFIYKKLLPYLKSMKLPVFLYVLIIVTMSFSSLLRIWTIRGYHFWLPFLGSILFITSDTILAFNEFKARIHNGDVYIMLTYITAQLLIVLGFM